MKSVSLHEVAELVGGVIAGFDGDAKQLIITGVNTLSSADASQISFLANKRYSDAVAQTDAAAILVSDAAADPDGCSVIRVRDPYLAFAKLQRLFHPELPASGIRHDSAVIHPEARLAIDVEVGANAVIGEQVTIGEGSRIGAGCIIGDRVSIGKNCLLHAKAVVAHDCVLGNEVYLQSGAVVGSDGFGYAWSGQQHLKIPQVGRVILEDDVEIGANTCIDRGAIEDTVIERGVKLDNQIQIAHNVRVGAFTVMASQVGISGSTTIGKGCQFGGQAGTAGHLNIGDGVKLAAKSGVISDLEAGGTYAGVPAMPHRMWLKVSALMMKLPELWKAQRNR
ncbi:UDP-3-O-[3-hydroxymyristoyl] glucosamine N-acyltransferase [Mariprofundus micogutta]|uniref:UDP-3-O-acylglucosamine N-acyltransferase n=1 Tax=Mariprofundus micogutta TaxID=1921010 RepID=A0A1L8CJU3_9PROT|nr:UDP-3-O-(3-hydroxymyristoyl)glucosamine N-acyltransferase [Mariprofundus micogutta]GAV19194.1 UDP-3-O-[3-hydroxymyristoyl] glucosamine N-acyltransferase [Mariprofundus micogutta]